MKTRLLILIVLVISITIPVTSFAEHPIQTEKLQDNFHEGTIEWASRCNMVMVTSDIIVRVIDYDMNKDPEKIEEFDVEIWSDFKDRIVDYTVIETGNDTGIFESIVFFTSNESPGRRIVAFDNSPLFDNSAVFAKYVDYTPPNTDKVDVIATFVMSGLSVLERGNDGHISKIVYDPCALELFDKNIDWFDELDIFYPAPLKQIESGLHVDEIQCKESLILVTKHNGSPACVKPETEWKLIERGWTTVDFSEEKIKVEKINGAKILDFSFDDKNKSIIVQIDSSSEGYLIITIPRNVLDSKVQGEDDDFFIIVDGKEVDFKETKNNTERTFTIPFESGAKEIEITIPILI